MAADFVKINVRVSAQKLDRLKAQADRIGCSYNYLIRRAIDKYLKEFGKLAADELGIEPGLCACDAEGCVYYIGDCGIVGYHRVCDNSYDITTAGGFKGVNRFLKLNEAGIDFYLKWYRRELEKIRVKEWPDADIPPAPPLMPPMPVFSRNFFVDAENE
jgi:hypothetical protein